MCGVYSDVYVCGNLPADILGIYTVSHCWNVYRGFTFNLIYQEVLENMMLITNTFQSALPINGFHLGLIFLYIAVYFAYMGEICFRALLVILDMSVSPSDR